MNDMSKKSNCDLKVSLDDIMFSDDFFTVVSKTKITFKNYSISKHEDHMWYVAVGKYKIGKFTLKSSALAAAKLHSTGNFKKLKNVVDDDAQFSYHYVDAVFHLHTMQHSKDFVTRESAEHRYDLSVRRAKVIKRKVDILAYSLFTMPINALCIRFISAKYTMKLSDYAKSKSIGYQTAWNHYKAGLIDGAYQLPTGTIIVPDAINARRQRRRHNSRPSVDNHNILCKNLRKP